MREEWAPPCYEAEDLQEIAGLKSLRLMSAVAERVLRRFAPVRPIIVLGPAYGSRGAFEDNVRAIEETIQALVEHHALQVFSSIPFERRFNVLGARFARGSQEFHTVPQFYARLFGLGMFEAACFLPTWRSLPECEEVHSRACTSGITMRYLKRNRDRLMPGESPFLD